MGTWSGNSIKGKLIIHKVQQVVEKFPFTIANISATRGDKKKCPLLKKREGGGILKPNVVTLTNCNNYDA